jgi:hypothetical protein
MLWHRGQFRMPKRKIRANFDSSPSRLIRAPFIAQSSPCPKIDGSKVCRSSHIIRRISAYMRFNYVEARRYRILSPNPGE